MPVGDPDTLGIRSVWPLAVDLDSSDRLARTQDRSHNMFHLLGDTRNGLTNRSSNMVRDRDSADFRQMLIYQQVTAVGAEKGETNRSGLINQLKLRRSSQTFNRT